MKQEYAKNVIKILLSADGGCKYCVADLLRLFCADFPEYKELAEVSFRENFADTLENFLKERQHEKQS